MMLDLSRMVGLMPAHRAYQFRQTYLAPHFGDESHSSPNRKDEGGAADTMA